ncbi:MAG TPA: methionine biosynthesis protein MetW [Deltaproteobacteria bacterium]|nr:methionine biosynthesis protein MetW [Deltaproteobacteria bacterium]
MSTLVTRNHAIIEAWVSAGARVLDLGCGDGTLLDSLMRKKHVNGLGVEIDQEKIISCLRKGICVHQTDIDQGLSNLDDMSFDYVVLNATLQVIHKPYRVMEEMLRVGRFAIISISNFGYLQNRMRILAHGRMSEHIRFGLEWHDTPAIRFVSVTEFMRSLGHMGIAVTDARYFLPLGMTSVDPPLKDLLVKEAIFRLRRD